MGCLELLVKRGPGGATAHLGDAKRGVGVPGCERTRRCNEAFPDRPTAHLENGVGEARDFVERHGRVWVTEPAGGERG